MDDNALSDLYATLPYSDKPWVCAEDGERFATLTEINTHTEMAHPVWIYEPPVDIDDEFGNYTRPAFWYNTETGEATKYNPFGEENGNG